MSTRRLLAPLLAALLLPSGCAYFNTFYNARQSYSDALLSVVRNPDNPSASEEEDLRNAIEGAGKVLTFYPESRWADDAQMLIADALLLLGSRSSTGSGTSSYQEAMLAYSSVMVMTEDERMMDLASIGIGSAAMALERYMDAAAAFRSVPADRRDLFVASRLKLMEALVLDGRPGEALPVLDTLEALDLSDSLRAETLLAGSSALSGMGMPDSAAAMAQEAGRLFGRGSGYYRALTAAAEAFIESGKPALAATMLNPLRMSYSTSRELASISFLSGRADEAAGNIPGALAAYGDAAELDMSREVGAEALYRQALLLESEDRLDEALVTLETLSRRGGGYFWIRLASDRLSEMRILSAYIDSIGTAPAEDADLFRFLAAEKRIDLYGADTTVGRELRDLSGSPDSRVRAMSLALLAESFTEDPDSSDLMLRQALALSDSGDMAGRIEAALGLPPGPSAGMRPSVLLERAWDLFGEGDFTGAWEAASDALASRWRLDAEPALLWMAYLSSEAAQMDDELVESYLTALVGRYPDSSEGIAAGDRLGGAVEEPDE